MNLAEVNWDINYAGRWPWPVKAAVIAIISLVVAGAWFYFDTQAQLDEWEQTERKEAELRTTFEVNQKKAANLGEYKKQLAEMEKSFGDMLRQLPDKTQVPELLVDVSQTGLAAGLEFELFKPLAEVKKDFYAELPIDIRVVGTYAKFGAFVSGLAALPRIVTVHSVRLKRQGAPQGAQQAGQQAAPKPSVGDAMLVMETQVKTYRYLDEGEESAPKKPVGAAPTGGKK